MTAAPEAGARAAPGRPDWRRAAEMIVQGHTVIEVARTLGCSRSQLSRKRNHDSQFQAWIEEFELDELTPERRMARLRRAWQEGVEKAAGKGDVRILVWLAERLNLAAPSGEAAPSNALHGILNDLSPDELRQFEDLRDPDQGATVLQLEAPRTTTSSPD